jgi:hypothetical protein
MYTIRKSIDLIFENYRGFGPIDCYFYLNMFNMAKTLGVGPIICILYDTVYYILFRITSLKLIPSKALLHLLILVLLIFDQHCQINRCHLHQNYKLIFTNNWKEIINLQGEEDMGLTPLPSCYVQEILCRLGYYLRITLKEF